MANTTGLRPLVAGTLRRQWTLLAILLLALATASQAQADSTTFFFTGTVTDLFAFGSDTIDDEFVLGETVDIWLTYDPDSPEDPSTIGDPDRGVYGDPAISFEIDFVESGRQFDMTGGPFQIVDVTNDLAGPGFVQDLVGTAAQKSVGGSIVGLVDGEVPTIVSLSLTDLEFGVGIPDMITSGMLPATPFQPANAIITFALGVTANLTVTVPEPSFAISLSLGVPALILLGRRRAEPGRMY
jgi:hypothetical protein